MCNLYRLRTAKAEISQIFRVEVPAGANFGEEVVKGYPGLMITGGRAQSMNWGFLAYFAASKDKSWLPRQSTTLAATNLLPPSGRAVSKRGVA
jgi:hypothetical protein